LFRFATTLEVKIDTLAVLNEDNGRESTEIMQRFSQAKAFTKLVLLRNEADGRRVLDNPQALLVIRIPADSSHKPVT
jgi:ABC-2 type transport system permease protein